MASISRKGSGYHVRVRIKGHPIVCRSFRFKADAQRWGVDTERAIQLGIIFNDPRTFGELLDRYLSEVTSSKKSAAKEAYRIARLRQSWLSTMVATDIKAHHIAKFRDDLLKTVAPSTCLRELCIISHVFSVAIRDWHLGLPSNPVVRITKPRAGKGRSRRLSHEEGECLLRELARSSNTWMEPLVGLALETGMRRGELLGLSWKQVFLEHAFCQLSDTKNGESRDVPLSLKALDILSGLHRHGSGKVLPIHPEALKSQWQRTTKRIGLENLRFHDLRHEAASRFFEKGLNVMEVASITGHKDLRMLKRYTHLRAADLAKKLG